MKLYALARVGRAGLGNSLFPWARAELFARETGAHLLAPRWTNIRIGPYLRGEPDKRRYWSFFRAKHHLRGLSRVFIETFGRRFSETEIEYSYRPGSSLRPCIVEFRGIGNFFSPLVGKHEFIRHQLWQMTVAPLRANARQYDNGLIAMHVRRGDLTRQGFSQHALRNDVTQYTPISWFASMARAVRRERSLDSFPLVVFTDGSPDELGQLLEIDGVRLHTRQTAITDLWMLTHARLLFASGFSTFSMWASFLGGMPTIYAPGKIQQRVQSERPNSFEIELEEDADLPVQLCIMIEQQTESADRCGPNSDCRPCAEKA
jgi:hypothetical protein